MYMACVTGLIVCVYGVLVGNLCVYTACVTGLIVCVYNVCVYDVCVYGVCVYGVCVYGVLVGNVCVYGANVWLDCAPSSDSLGTFKKRLKTHLLNIIFLISCLV